MSWWCQKCKKIGGSPNSFWREHRASLAKKATVAASPKILQLQLLREMFSAKYGLRWLNRVMQDHEARASDLNRKLIFSFFLLFS